jgi:hypothetical protein
MTEIPIAETIARLTFVYDSDDPDPAIERLVDHHIQVAVGDVFSRRSRDGFDYFVVTEVELLMVEDDDGVPVSRVEQLVLLLQTAEPGDEDDPPENATVTPTE